MGRYTGGGSGAEEEGCGLGRVNPCNRMAISSLLA